MKEVTIKNGIPHCLVCERLLVPGSRAWTFPMGENRGFMCDDCRSHFELREGLTDLVALHGGGSLGRQFKTGAKRGVVLGSAYILLACIIGLPGLAIVVLGLLGSCTGHNYWDGR